MSDSKKPDKLLRDKLNSRAKNALHGSNKPCPSERKSENMRMKLRNKKG